MSSKISRHLERPAVQHNDNGGVSLQEPEYERVPQVENEALRSASRTPLLHLPRSERYPRSNRRDGSRRYDSDQAPASNSGNTPGEQMIEDRFNPYLPQIRRIGGSALAGPSHHDENHRPQANSGESTDFDEQMIEMQELNPHKPPLDSKMVSNNASAAALLNRIESAPGTAAQGRGSAEATAAGQDQEHRVEQVSDTASYDSAERQAAAEAAAESMLAPLPGQRAPWERPPVRERVVRPAVADDFVEYPAVENDPVADEPVADDPVGEADAEPSDLDPEYQAILDKIRAIGNPAIPPDFGPAPVVDDPVADDPVVEQPVTHNSAAEAGPERLID
ncbi:hypothetical protein LTR95_010402 [Oleoguttula sp. CCFEE 5521]